MSKARCQGMLEDLLYEALDAGAANRNVSPSAIGKFVDTCVREPRGGLGRRPAPRRRRRKARR
jgi:hypothetical protein